MPTRRVIRKTRSRAATAFDDQLWPVNVALALLGGFSIGVTAAFLRFDDPRPLHNAWTSIIGIAVITGAVMVGMRWVSNRMVRRGMQLAIALAVLLHLAFIIAAHSAHVLGRAWTAEVAQEDLTRRRDPVTVQDFMQLTREENEPVDFEKPVETETPSPEPEEVEKDQPQEQDVRQPQPTPVPETDQTDEPRPVERKNQTETAPRSSPTPSRLSRRRSDQKIAAAIPSPNAQASPRKTSAPATDAQPTEIERVASSRSPERSMSRTEPAESQPTKTAIRRAESDSPKVAQDSTRPTPSRRTVEAKVAAAPAETRPRVSKSTSEPAVNASAVTPVARQQTTSPAARRNPTDVEPSQIAAREVERRHIDSPDQTQVANSPQPVPTRRPRVTNRPDASVAAEVDSPNPNSSTPTATAQIQPQATQIASARRPNRTEAPLRSVEPLATPLESSSRPTRRTETQNAPTSQATVRTTPRQRNNELSPSPAIQTAAKTAAVTNETTRADVSAQSVAVTKQATTNAEAAPTESTASANTSGARPNSIASRSSTPRRQAETSPVTESSAETARTRSRATRNAVQLTSPTPAAASDRAPSLAQQSRIQASEAGVARRNVSAPASQASGSANPTVPTEVASSRSATATRRTTASPVPSLTADASAAQSPARTPRSISVASTARSQSAETASAGAADGRPTVEPSAMAMNRGQSGVAGAGGSPNLDRSSPAADTPSQVASSAARRRVATQDTPQGPALRPQAPALTRNTRAMSERSTSVFAPQEVTVANSSATSRVAELDSSASAALEQSLSNAESASITGAAGATEIDLGPTRVVSESGAARNRSAGGGQPEVHSDGDPQPTRRRSLGSPELVVAVDGVGSPAQTAEAGGQSQPLQASVASSLGERAQASEATSTASGQPSSAESTTTSEAAELGSPQLARAELGGELAEPATSSGEEEDDDEEDEEKKRARRLAERMRGGAPQLAIAGARVALDPAPAESVAGNATAPASVEAVAAAGEIGRLSNNGAPANSAAAEAGGGELASTRLGDAQSARAEVADGSTGAPKIGGGSPSLSRRSTGPSFAAASQAETIAIAGQTSSTGEPSGSPIAASSASVGKQNASESEPTISDSPGGSPGELPTGALASATAQRADGGGAGGGPEISDSTSNATARRSARQFAPSSQASFVGAPSPGDIPVAMMEGPSAQFGDQTAALRRQAAGAIAVESAAKEGPGGLGSIAAINAGLNSRRAQRDSMQVHTRPVRYLKKDTGGALSLNSSVVVAKEAFAGRNPSGRRNRLGPQTERAIDLGLAFLARNQLEDGRWTLQGYDAREAQMSSDTAATGLALLAFQGAGYHHKDYEYKANCNAAVQFLVSIQKDNGDLYLPSDEFSNSAVWLYSHGIAALALTEAYGMTQDPALKEPAQKALDFIAYAQDPKSGGWRYTPQGAGDTSVTGWMMMALKSGQLAGLDVADDTYERIDRWLERASTGPSGEKFRYNPDAPDTPTQRHGRNPTTTMTAVGLLMKFYAGQNRDSVSMKKGAVYLLDRLPGVDDKSAYDARRDTYYWYYATQVMFHMKGEYWEKWNESLRPRLLRTQVQQGPQAGSWDPIRPVPDRWGAQAGRLFVTTLNLLSLEVRFRHMPLNEFTGR